ncbi:MAG: serine hydrolase [Dehalococcoidales bacterium]|nr:serine hydrolase [Dehalococcoidales bacterium]
MFTMRLLSVILACALLFSLAGCATDHPPVITPPGTLSIAEGANLSFTVLATDADNDPVALSVTGLPAGATFDSQNRLFSWTPSFDQTGAYYLSIKAESGKATATSDFSVTVTNVNRPPSVNAVENKTVGVNNTLILPITAADPDGDTLTLTAVGLPEGAVFDAANGLFTWKPRVDQAGSSANVTFTATDGVLTDTKNVNIKVNQPPTLAAIGDKSVTVGESLTFTVNATDSDRDALVYSVENLPAGADFNTTTGVFSWTPDTAQVKTFSGIRFLVDDGMSQDIQTIKITVNQVPVPVPVAVDETLWPTGGWLTSSPAAQNMDSAKLDQAAAANNQQGLALDSMVVVRNGYLVYEYYPRASYNKDTPHTLYSCTKSVLGALVSIAIDEGAIQGYDSKMVSFFTDRNIQNNNALKQSITVKNLLEMRGGMQWDEWRYLYSDSRNDFIKALNSPDPVQYFLDTPMAVTPGTVWNYNGGFTYLLADILTKQTRKDVNTYAREKLFTTMGITNYSWNKDAHGNYEVSGGLRLTPRDMAKFGYLMLHKGNWNGTRLVPEAYVTTATSTISSFSSNSGYGYESWWTHDKDGLFYAAGIYGQYIYVSPSQNLIVVFTANNTGADPETQMRTLMANYILPACK